MGNAMALSELNEYINHHGMVDINLNVGGVLFSEVIVSDWEALLERVYALGFRISQVGWWEYTHIGSSPVLGGGGQKDLTNPDFYFADIYSDGFTKNFPPDAKLEMVRDYIQRVQGEFVHLCKIVPAFTIEVG